MCIYADELKRAKGNKKAVLSDGFLADMAEREGFEPSMDLHPYYISSVAH
jgi:hypothetical protein